MSECRVINTLILTLFIGIPAVIVDNVVKDDNISGISEVISTESSLIKTLVNESLACDVCKYR